jgi:D-sedoheptulose 7-phosphate isomerase
MLRVYKPGKSDKPTGLIIRGRVSGLPPRTLGRGGCVNDIRGGRPAIGSGTAEDVIVRAIQESCEVKAKLLDQQLAALVRLAMLFVESFRKGGKVVLFGNGGSAAEAQHVAAEFIGRFGVSRMALPALALTTDTSVLSAVGNDFTFEEIFARQVQALVHRGDVAVGISTSGNSENVVRGVLAAKDKGATTVGLTGRSGGRLKELVDIHVAVPSESTPRIQEAQISVWHSVCEVVDRELFGTTTGVSAPTRHAEAAR